MSSAETISRQWDLLQMIPRLPRRIAATELHSRLAAEFDVSLRTVQRAEECYPLLEQDHSRDRDVAGPIATLRCVGFHANGQVIGVLKTHRPGQPSN